MKEALNLKLTSHVGRDLLASAASFKTEAAVIWEYVVNSLQYVDEHAQPKILVSVQSQKKRVEISDNGRGMDAEDLQRFFTMHGENIDRRQGRPGRGKFGTGKSAAFGVGMTLRVDTVRAGLRNVVELTREAIDSSDGKDVGVTWQIRNEPTDRDNGTTVAIERIFLPKIKTAQIIDYIERHLQVFRSQKPEVAVNEHVCEYKEPSISESFEFKPNEEQAAIVGDVELKVNVSSVPLPKAEQGIAVTAGLGNLVAIETAGVDAKEQGNYLFGEIDVPALETFDCPVEAYDSTRSLQLNLQHPVAQALIPFIGSKLEEVRKHLLKKLADARRSEEARRLAREADKIAELINEDFRSVMGRLADIRSASARTGGVGARFGNTSEAGDEEGVWIEGTAVPGTLSEAEGKGRETPPGPGPQLDPNIIREGDPDKKGEASLDPAGGKDPKSHRPRGGFSVDYRHLGADEDRSKYDDATLTILINLDHSVVKNALSVHGAEDINFRRLSYEIAFTEYAIEFGYEILKQDPDMPADDILFDVKATLNRVSTAAAPLYGNSGAF